MNYRLTPRTILLIAVGLTLFLVAACQPIQSPQGDQRSDAMQGDALSAAETADGLPPAPFLTPAECQLLLATVNDFIRADDYAAVVDLVDIVSNCGVDDDMKAGLLFIRAESNMKQGEWRTAIDDYRNSLSLGLESDDAAGARNNICWFLALDGQAEAALPYCEQAVEAQPVPSYLDSRALAYAITGNLEGAIADFEAALDQWALSTNPEIQAIYEERRQWVDALKSGENPITPEVLAKLQAEDAPALRADLESSLSDEATQRLLRGRRHHIYRQFDKAVAEYTKAIDLDPDFALAYFYRGLIYRWQGEWSDTLEDMRSVILLKPDQAFAHHVAGLMQMRQDNYEEAVAAFSTAIDLLPNELEFYADRAAAYFSLGDAEGALADLDMSLRFQPDSADLLFMRGAAHRALDNRGEAIADLERALELGLPPDLAEQAKNALGELRSGFF